MDATAATLREVAVPASIFEILHRELAREAGELPTIHALHAAGYAAGEEASTIFRQALGRDPGGVTQASFWQRFAAFFDSRGWGTLAHDGSHDAVGFLVSGNWVEARGDESRSGCMFTSGFLAGFLTEIAGGPVAVLEVACRRRGDPRCSFAFGSEAVVHDLYGDLLAGRDLDAALAEL
ncbi:MAG: 4-vinyl reductase [Longimicrobiales bacterium]